jgi:DNA topoisomerase VI subunit B
MSTRTNTAQKPKLTRSTIATSRLMDFCSEKELTAQIGHARDDWPLVILKELIDNGLDACEEAGVAPEIDVRVTPDEIVITDNGPGIPAGTIEKILDFSIRVSSREAYVAPDRGKQGNALKTVLMMPFALDGNTGHVEIIAKGVRHIIDMSADAIRQQPVIDYRQEPGLVKNGTCVSVGWPVSSKLANSILADAKGRFLPIAEDYTFLNPHLTLSLDWMGDRIETRAIDPEWAKWRPSEPTSAHWYGPEHFRRIIGAYIAADQDSDRDRTVREFIAEFRGLSGTAKRKQVLEASGLGRMNLSALANGHGIDATVAGSLLSAMQQNSKPVKPADLGVIGRESIAARFAALGCEMQSFVYRKVGTYDRDGLPFILEAAFVWHDGLDHLRLITGVNWSPGIVNPFRTLAYAQSLDSLLGEQRIEDYDPVVVFVHLAHPRVQYLDRGKSSVATTMQDIERIVREVTQRWTRQKKAEDREASRRLNRCAAMARSYRTTIKDVAWEVMPTAYKEASSNGKYPAKARQIYYAARRMILPRIDTEKLDADYFEQTLLPNYLQEHPAETTAWRIAYDARGHLAEPHTGRKIELGTVQVLSYLDESNHHAVDEITAEIDAAVFPTVGPTNRYGAVLFIEKEGFDDLFRIARLAERYDLGIMSTKGMSNTAARTLIDALCETDLPLFVLHDFDKSGLSILSTLRRDTRRYKFDHDVHVIDLGVRLEDVRQWNLQSEPQPFKSDPTDNLRTNGASDEEITFLRGEWDGHGYAGQRVELNAFTSENLLKWIEDKLREHGIKKVIPDAKTLETAYRRAHMIRVLNEQLEPLVAAAKEESDGIDVDADRIGREVEKQLQKSPAMSWDEAVAEIVGEGT